MMTSSDEGCRRPSLSGSGLFAALFLCSSFVGGCHCAPGDDRTDSSTAPGRDASGSWDAAPSLPDAHPGPADAAVALDAEAAPADAGAAEDAALTTDAGPADAGGLPSPSFCAAYVAAECDWYLQCGNLDAAQLADCRAILGWTCSQAQVSALAAGKLLYDPLAAAQCVAAVAGRPCDQPYVLDDSCSRTFTPNTPVGGTCTRQWSTVCAGSYCKTASCPGTCTAFTPVGEVCEGLEGDECGPGATCAYSSPRRCVALLDPGAACVANDPCRGGACDTAQQECLSFGSQPAGAACSLDAVCGAGLYCEAGLCAPSQTLGGPCRLWGGADCAAGFTCRITPGDAGTTGTCQPSADEGGACFGLPADCKPGLACSSPSLLAAGTCLAPQAAGAACDAVAQNCKVALHCNPSTLRCLALPSVGEPCLRDPLNVASSDCLDGYCPAADAGTTCAAPQAAGAPCERPWECASAICEGGLCVDLCTP